MTAVEQGSQTSRAGQVSARGINCSGGLISRLAFLNIAHLFAAAKCTTHRHVHMFLAKACPLCSLASILCSCKSFLTLFFCFVFVSEQYMYKTSTATKKSLNQCCVCVLCQQFGDGIMWGVLSNLG